tara:strand:- start:1224 stop:1949 length:726 start_codon:yes stop_codon:yes gene_type:complete
LRLLLTRPTKDSRALASVIQALGFKSTIAPILDISILKGPKLNCNNVAALAMTSANGVRAFSARSERRDLAVYAVGDSTARTAQHLGFSNIFSASGNVGNLADLIIESVALDIGEILHPAATHVAGNLKERLVEAGLKYRREIIYESVTATAFSPEVTNMIKANQIDGVLLFSPRTSFRFKFLIDKAGLAKNLRSMRAYCLSPEVAKNICSLPLLEICIAEKPDQKSLLKLLRDREVKKIF